MAGAPTGQGALCRAWARALGRLVHCGGHTSNDPIRLPRSRRRLVRHALGRASACGRPATVGALHHGVWCGRILRSRGVVADHPLRTVRRRRQPVPRPLSAPLGHRQGATFRERQQGLQRVLEDVPLRSALLALEYAHRRQAWFVGLPRRHGRPEATTFYKGTQWIGFNRRSADAVLGTDPAVTEWFKRSHIPDETYLQTVLHNAPGLNVSNDLVTFVPESPLRPTARWMVLSREDLPTVWRSEAAFARKVDPDARPDVIKAIEKVETERRTRGISQTKRSGA